MICWSRSGFQKVGEILVSWGAIVRKGEKRGQFQNSEIFTR